MGSKPGSSKAETHDRMKAGHAEVEGTDRAARRRRDQASLFRWDARMEKLLELKESDRAAYTTKIPAVLKMALGNYVNSKRAAELEGIDTSAPAGAGGGGE